MASLAITCVKRCARLSISIPLRSDGSQRWERIKEKARRTSAAPLRASIAERMGVAKPGLRMLLCPLSYKKTPTIITDNKTGEIKEPAHRPGEYLSNPESISLRGDEEGKVPTPTASTN
jgi:hypothetical protein